MRPNNQVYEQWQPSASIHSRLSTMVAHLRGRLVKQLELDVRPGVMSV